MPYKVIPIEDFYEHINFLDGGLSREEAWPRAAAFIETKLNNMEKEGWVFAQSSKDMFIFKKEVQATNNKTENK